MGTLRITIHNRSFDISCPDDEEEQVRAMANALSKHVASLARNVQDASDTYLLMLSAMSLTAEVHALTIAQKNLQAQMDTLESNATNAIMHATQFIESLIERQTQNNLPE